MAAHGFYVQKKTVLRKRNDGRVEKSEIGQSQFYKNRSRECWWENTVMESAMGDVGKGMTMGGGLGGQKHFQY